MIVLDTHIWLWWVNDDSASLKAEWRELIDNASEVGVSAISCFEVAWLERHGRIALPQPRTTWFEKALDGSGISLLPVSAAPAWEYGIRSFSFVTSGVQALLARWQYST